MLGFVNWKDIIIKKSLLYKTIRLAVRNGDTYAIILRKLQQQQKTKTCLTSLVKISLFYFDEWYWNYLMQNDFD